MACSLLSRDTAGRTLSVTAPVSDVFAGGATRLVPLFTGILTSAEPAVVSDGMETWSVEFRELRARSLRWGRCPTLLPGRAHTSGRTVPTGLATASAAHRPCCVRCVPCVAA